MIIGSRSTGGLAPFRYLHVGLFITKRREPPGAGMQSMAEKKKVLLQLDCDPNPSAFDSIVAIDSGIDCLLSYSDVEPSEIEPLVHGAMFTRGGTDLRSTAIFLGGSQVDLVESSLRQVLKTFFGPVRVSVMADPNGCNTTAVAAVLSASKHLNLEGSRVAVLGGTGPVGRRIVELTARAGGTPVIVSRSIARATAVAEELAGKGIERSRLRTAAAENAGEFLALLQGCSGVFSAGAAGVQFLGDDWMDHVPGVRVALDCNAVPPAGLPGIAVHDRAKTIGQTVVYGAVGIGELKMKIHKRALAKLFTANDLVLDLLAIESIGRDVANGC